MKLPAGKKRWWLLVPAILVVVAAVFGVGLAETHRIEIKRFTITSPDLPASFDGTRIAFVTDVHRGAFFSQARVGKLVERVNALHPDMIVLGGDYVYANTDYEESCFAELAKLEAPLGRFAVLGNHDYGEYDRSDGSSDDADPGEAIQAIDGAGLILLLNRGVWVSRGESRIRVGGVGDYQEDTPLLAPTIDGTNRRDFVILISHNPDFAEELPPGAVDLTLSGHTHGGQVTFFGVWAPYLPSDYGQKYRTGLVMTDSTTVIVSNGIGTIFPPVRLFARPQIVEVTLNTGPSAVLGP